MKNTIPKVYILLYASLPFLLFSCAELFDCVASARPEIHSKNLSIGRIGNIYSDFIDSDVTNDANDNAYDYFFSVDGNLPSGMTYNGQGRKIFFTGRPTQAGTFKFKVKLTVAPPNYYNPNQDLTGDGNRICFDKNTTFKEFTIVIE